MKFRSFFIMFGIVFLLNLNYTVLRSVRNTLAIADLGGSAASIPYFELLGVLPAALLMTWFLSHILTRFSMRNVFLITLFIFIGFFLIFASLCYPVLQAKMASGSRGIVRLSAMVFFVLGELWKPALMQILFWGLINLNITSEKAKQLYPSLILGSCLGAIVAGPLTTLCTSSGIWAHSFVYLMLCVFAVGCITGALYHYMCRLFEEPVLFQTAEEKKSISFSEAIKWTINSRPLRLISWIVLANYIAFALGEVIFLEILKHKFPDPSDYCRYMGYLGSLSSVLTIVSALFIAPIIVRKFRWVISALALPVTLLLIEGSFFIFLRAEGLSSHLFGWSHAQWISVVAILGSIHYSACRAIKYSLFDSSKELSFVSLPKVEQVNGKLIIDGICSRLGRGGASALSLSFMTLAGGILASSFLAGIAAIAMAYSCVIATKKLGGELKEEVV